MRRRHVFFLPGYDPSPPRRYRELYRREAARQAAVTGLDMTVRGEAAGDGPYQWLVTAADDGAPVDTVMEVLVWFDIVHRSMRRSIAMTYPQMLRTAWTYLRSGALGALLKIRKGPFIAALYPPVALILYALAALLLVRWGGMLAAGLGWPAAVGWGAGACLGVALLIGLRRLDGRLFVYYLLHDYAYSASCNGATPPEMAARLDRYADRIAAVAADGRVDEILIVGHSSGAHLAVELTARALDRIGPASAEGRPALGLLTLGQVIPMVGFLPGAGALRRDLNRLAQSARLTWVDVSAPGDGASFALCDPVAINGVDPGAQAKRGPLVLSAAFTHTLSEAQKAGMRWNFFRRHIQYLCAFDHPDAYDYFAITAGAQTLAARFDGRESSPSTIRRVLSPHSGMDP
ncbi:alpha/beta fold hydrolase [Oceanomicrobium pacificus]|uniref:Alpha/beta hydrolase n=1 Tax=Oceanomicrobium pacificus TaxID=2692916 RepID=A0A6B0TYK1_9RHOB|nr:hypothetical protein [Oceanomicrobium pacificus]MXU66352.1 hypothetical protein [Oceanomicrobium pacificus]